MEEKFRAGHHEYAGAGAWMMLFAKNITEISLAENQIRLCGGNSAVADGEFVTAHGHTLIVFHQTDLPDYLFLYQKVMLSLNSI